MRRIRFLVLGFVTFVAAIFGALLAPGTWVNRVFSTLVCGIFSFNSMVCTANWGQSSQRVVAATPPAVEKTIFDGFSDLLAQRDPSEFGDDQPSAPSPQQSNPQAPPFPQDPGPNFPVRPELDNPDQKPANVLPPSTQTATTRSIAFELTSVTELSSDIFKLELASKEGCRSMTTIKQQNGQVFQQSIKLVSPGVDVCGYESSTTTFSPDGSQFKVTLDNSSASLNAQLNEDGSAMLTYISPTGESQTTRVQVPSTPNNTKLNPDGSSNKNFTGRLVNRGLPIYNNPNIVNTIAQNNSSRNQSLKSACEGLNNFCLRASKLGTLFAGLEFAGGLAVAAEFVSAAALTPLFVASGVTFFSVGVVCFFLTGGLPPIAPKIKKPITQVNGLGFVYSYVSTVAFENNIPIPPVNALRKRLRLDICDNPTQPQQTAQQPQQEVKQCRVRWEDVVANNPPNRPNGTYINRGTCVIRGAVMTEQGLADGTNECGVCNTYYGGLKPKLGSCGSGSLSVMGIRRGVLYCPPNWDSGW